MPAREHGHQDFARHVFFTDERLFNLCQDLFALIHEPTSRIVNLFEIGFPLPGLTACPVPFSLFLFIL